VPISAIPPLFYRPDALPAAQPTVKALKATTTEGTCKEFGTNLSYVDESKTAKLKLFFIIKHSPVGSIELQLHYKSFS